MNRILILSIFLMLFAVIILPREFYQEDMVVHIPFMQKVLDSNIFYQDYFIKYGGPQQFLTIYYPFIALLSKTFPFTLSTNFGLFRSIYYFFFFFVCLRLSQLFTKQLLPGILFIFLLLFRFQVGGAAVQVFEVELYPRAIGIFFILLTIFFLIKHKIILSVITFIISGLFHPLTCLYFFVTFLFYKFLSKKRNLKLPPFYVIVLTLILISSSVIVISNNFLISSEWLMILRERTPYAFISLWKPISWLLLILLLIPGLLFTSKIESNKLSIFFKSSLLVALLLTLINLVFTGIFPLSQIISLQLGRIWLYPIYISIFILSVVLSLKVKNKTQATILFAIMISMTAIYNINKRMPNPQMWIDAQQWVLENTQSSCKILVPFSSKGFRVHSKRPITGEIEDGGLALYSQEFAQLWDSRRRDLGSWETLSKNAFETLWRKYDANYAVSARELNSLIPVYKNAEYKIYLLNKNCEKI